MAKKKKTGWTPGKGGSKKAQDYYREKQAEYGRRPDQGSRRPKKDARIKQAEKTRTLILQEAQQNPNFVIDPELFTRNKAGISNADPTGKLREGMTGAEYHDFMRQLHGANPAAMEKAFPWGSGKGLRSLANLAMPAPLKMFGEMAGDMGTTVKQGLTKIFPGPAKDFGAEYKRLQSSFPWNRKKNEKISETLEMITDPSQNIYDIHPGSAIQPESENIFNEDTDNAILEDLLGVDAYAYDPTQDIEPGEYGKDEYWKWNDPQGSKAYETEDWLGDVQPKIDAIKKQQQEERLYGPFKYDPDEDEEPGEWGEGIDWKYNYPGGSKAFETEDWLGEIQPKLDAIKEERLNELLDSINNNVFDSRRLGLGEGPLTYGEPKANLPLDSSGGEILDLLDLMKVSPGAPRIDWGFNRGGLASIDPYRGTMGGGMNPSGWSPDPTVRSVTGYEKGGLMNNGNPVDYHNLRNTNKYYGSF